MSDFLLEVCNAELDYPLARAWVTEHGHWASTEPAVLMTLECIYPDLSPAAAAAKLATEGWSNGYLLVREEPTSAQARRRTEARLARRRASKGK